MCEKDPDIVRWGLHLLLGDQDGDHSTACENSHQNDATTDRSTAYGDGSQMNPPIADGTRMAEINNTMTQSVVENDESIAHALQEELSQVAFAKASGTSDGDEQQLHAAILKQEWFHPSVGTSAIDREDMEPSSSCSSPQEKSSDDNGGFIELTDDFFALDGEVGRRLSQMVSIPHIPKINGEIPSTDEAISDHQRLLDRLVLYNLVELKVKGDGNCQFQALSDQFYRNPEHHKFVRQQVVNQLVNCSEIYNGYVPMDYDDYISKMSRNGEWGDHVTLQAAADLYGVKIFVLTSFKDTCYIEILPAIQKSERVILLSFWAEVHYNSIYPEGELPAEAVQRKRKRGLGLGSCLIM